MNAFSLNDISDDLDVDSVISPIINRLNEFAQELEGGELFAYEFIASWSHNNIKISRCYLGVDSPWCFIISDGSLCKPASYNSPCRSSVCGSINDLNNEEFVINNIYGF